MENKLLLLNHESCEVIIMGFSVILATDLNGALGFKGQLPWPKLKHDMKHFREKTLNHTIVMGRRTWDSFNGRVLDQRKHIILSRDQTFIQRINTSSNHMVSATDDLDTILNTCDGAVVIGGKTLYEAALTHRLCDTVFLTRIYGIFEADVSIDLDQTLKQRFKEVSRSTTIVDNDIPLQFVEYKATTGEHQYLDLVQRVLDRGIVRSDRTGVGTIASFGENMRFSLHRGTVPLLTTKKMYWKGVKEELFWFLSGSTDTKRLSRKGVRIWDANSTRDFLDKRGLKHYQPGDIGPSYGFQWRHAGAEYQGSKQDGNAYTDQGVDQIKRVINLLRSNPESRRILMTAWNVRDINKMALPPCHVLCQFLVQGKKLTCVMYQRSADIGLGVPFNIASYALLTHLIAHCTGHTAHELVHMIGDAHVYQDHVEPLKKQLERSPLDFPTIRINTTSQDIDAISSEHVLLCNYHHKGTISMKMAI